MSDLNATQPSFSSGILSAELFSRIDFSKVSSGLRECENWTIRPAGGAEYRAGTLYLSEAAKPTGSIMVPFSGGSYESYAIEFNENVIRFFQDRALVGNTVTTDYKKEDLRGLKFAQDKDCLFIVHNNYPPRKLIRSGDGTWRIEDMVFNPPEATITNLKIQALGAKNPETVVKYNRWQYAVSVVNPDGEESLALKSNIIESDISLVNQNIKITFTAPSTLETGTTFNVYRISRGEFAFIYKLEYDAGKPANELVDISFAPDATKTIKRKFEGFDDQNYPGAIGFHNQRLILGNTKKKPNAIYGSRVGEFEDFTNSYLNNADEGFELELFAGSLEKILDIIPMDDMIIHTDKRIWRVVGTTPSNMQAYIESYSGVSGLVPDVYKKSILYVDSSLNTVSNFVYSYEINGYSGQNLDILCRSLFDGHVLVDTAFRSNPYGIYYAIRDDGVMLCLTYLREQNIYAWHQHTTNGKFRSVCVVSRPKNDDVYVVVERNGQEYVEVFSSHIKSSDTIDDACHLDCSTRKVSDVVKWKNREESQEVTKTYRAYKLNEENTWECWESTVLPVGFPFWCPKGTKPTDARYITKREDFTAHTKTDLQADGRASSLDYLRRDPSRDFTDALPDVMYVLEEKSGAKVYEKVGEEFKEIGVTDNYYDEFITFRLYRYKEYSAFNEVITTTVVAERDLYTIGEPKPGDKAYIDETFTAFKLVTSATGDTIVVENSEYKRDSSRQDTITEVSGLERFEGQKITAVIDGNEYNNLLVENGTVSAGVAGKVWLVGLPYVGILSPIPIDVGQKDGGTTVGLNRKICQATIRYYRTRGIWYGTDLNHMYEVKPYTQANFAEPIPLETGVLNTEINDDYKQESSFYIKQDAPFPALVQSITLEIAYGEKG